MKSPSEEVPSQTELNIVLWVSSVIADGCREFRNSNTLRLM